jgi:hypothetical protein
MHVLVRRSELKSIKFLLANSPRAILEMMCVNWNDFQCKPNEYGGKILDSNIHNRFKGNSKKS